MDPSGYSVSAEPAPDADDAATPGAADVVPTLVETLYAQYFSALVKFLAATFGQGPPPPEDTAQQTFEHLMKNGGLETARNPKALLWHAARNLAISARKGEFARDKRERDYDFFQDDGYQLTPERVIEAKAAYSAAVEVIQSMPSQRREAFVLVRIDGLTHAAAAERLGVSRAAVSKHVARALVQLTRALTDD
ncbi:MAG: sigma-70 family RNA polymerase sigma factor [Pseudomonadota bacterium]